jgi:predicted Zn-dependent protease
MTIERSELQPTRRRAVSEPFGAEPGSGGDFLSEDECRAVFDRCRKIAGADNLQLKVMSGWMSGVQWARNRAHLARDIRLLQIRIELENGGRRGTSSTSRTDPESLQAAVTVAKMALSYDVSSVRPDNRPERSVQSPLLHPVLWSETTVKFNGERRGDIARRLIDGAESVTVMSAGNLDVSAFAYSVLDSNGTDRYYPVTRAQFSTTVRDANGTGSGWAGTDDFDIARIDMAALGKRALDKCVMSINPVAIEPGRYTTILEPQAVADLWRPLMQSGLDRADSQDPRMEMPFYRSPGQSKITERVIDARVTVSSDPMDPIGGFLPFRSTTGDSYVPVKWIDGGVLNELSYSWFFAMPNLGKAQNLLTPSSWRMSGGTISVEEMISTTKRGLLVTRLHGVKLVHSRSFTCTGYTRDGVWLIENGMIRKPAKNFRFTESPLLAFNRIDQLGNPQRVFSGDMDSSLVAPPLKVHDFNFTQVADAV